MEPMPLDNTSARHYNAAEQEQLLALARKSVAHGLKHGAPLDVDLSGFPETLNEHRATFVTLEKAGKLRGCIGALEATRPLAEDVARNAFAAAFRDPRFAPIGEAEWPELELHISILSPPVPVKARTEEELLSQLRPGIDGLILEDGLSRATFLPSVWENVSGAQDFVRHLKRKAGLPMEYWSDTLRIFRYTAQSIPE